MNKIAYLTLLALAGIACAHADGMKPGLWETKVTRQVIDGRDMSAQFAEAQQKMQSAMAHITPEQRKQMEQAMANMPPEQRKRMEGMMNGSGASMMGSNGAIRMCLTAAQLSKDSWVRHDAKCGDATKITRSGNGYTIEGTCTKDGETMVMHGETTVSGETASMRMDVQSSGRNGNHTIHSESQMTYLGADCQGVKPIDELVGNYK